MVPGVKKFWIKLENDLYCMPLYQVLKVYGLREAKPLMMVAIHAGLLAACLTECIIIGVCTGLTYINRWDSPLTRIGIVC